MKNKVALELMQKKHARLTAHDFRTIANAVFDNITYDELISYTSNNSKDITDQINQIKAINSLGQLKDARAIQLLIKIMSHGPLYSRLAASNALGIIGLPAVKDLIQCLGKIKETQDTQPPKEGFWDKSYYVHDPAARTLVRIGIVAVPALLEHLNTDSDFEIQQAIDALGRIGDKDIAKLLINKFHDYTNTLTKWKIVRAIGELRDSYSTIFLISILEDHILDPFIRWEAADALGKIGDPIATNILITALQDSNHEVRRLSARALGKIKDQRAVQPLEILIKSLPKNSSRKTVLYEAIKSLDKIKIR